MYWHHNLCNLAHSITSKPQILFYLQLYFANLFFLTIFFYVGDNVITNRWGKIAFYVFVTFMILTDTSILVLRYKFGTCSQKWDLIFDSFTILISVFMFLIYCKKNMDEKRMQNFYSQTLVDKEYRSHVNLNSPFIRMWILISSNIFCGVVNLISTTILYFRINDADTVCTFNSNQNINAAIKFAFALSDYYLGSVVTLIILHRIRVLAAENMKIEKARKESYTVQSAQANKLQLIPTSSNRSFSIAS